MQMAPLSSAETRASVSTAPGSPRKPGAACTNSRRAFTTEANFETEAALRRLLKPSQSHARTWTRSPAAATRTPSPSTRHASGDTSAASIITRTGLPESFFSPIAMCTLYMPARVKRSSALASAWSSCTSAELRPSGRASIQPFTVWSSFCAIKLGGSSAWLVDVLILRYAAPR
eukprot:scaffold100935_cov29-Tisochrysis_lutea.AAC.3